MSYEPNTWKTGDRITEEKLNHIEQGILYASEAAEEVIVVNAYSEWNAETESYENVHADKSSAEIIELINSGKTVIVAMHESNNPSIRWMNLSSNTANKAMFTAQEVHDDIDTRYNVSSYTLEFISA